MYLSRLLLTGSRLHNPYEIHRFLWMMFPSLPNQKRDFLFRVEQSTSRQVQVLMQSQRKPENVIHKVQVKLLAVKEIKMNLYADMQLRFLLTANPTKTIIDEQRRLNSNSKVKKCRVPLIKEDEQIEWLRRKLANAALVNRLEIEKQLPLYFRKGGTHGKVQPYSFRGILQIGDVSLLEVLMQRGIGPAKAFGCGLLSLAPA